MTDHTVKIGSGIEIYESKITEYLDQYVRDHNIPDLDKLTQGKWNAILLDIHDAVINRDDLMSEINKSAYDGRKIDAICDIYIKLCYMHDKEISINGFSFLTGIHRDTLYTWGDGERRSVEYYDDKGELISNIGLYMFNHPDAKYTEKLSSSCSDVYKKLVANNEESLSCKLISGTGNPMKILPALNRRHNWNMPGSNKPGGDEQAPTLEQIEERRQARIAQGAPDQLPVGDF